MVILLVTGSLCAGKGLFAEILKEKYGYTVLTVTSAKVENIWDFDKQAPILENKEKILKETKDLINISLKNWDQNQVIGPIYFPESVDQITKKRSYFKIVGIVCPLGKRMSVAHNIPKFKDLLKKDLLKVDDYMNFHIGVSDCVARSEFQIFNKTTKEDMEKNLAKHDLITKKFFRPSWDTYFMKLAHVVRERSNCMKRSVGAILVCGNRIVSTGYNGTPTILTNCYQGGCKMCNENLKDAYDKCNCIHAEEAAILECGVHRAVSGTLYSTNAPCRWCVKILIQAEVSRVVYDVIFFDEEMNKMMEEAGIQVDCISYKLCWISYLFKDTQW